MRRNWLLIGIGLIIALFAVAAIACDDNDEEEAIDDILEEFEDELDELGVIFLSANLTEVDGSGASGAADLSLNGDGILVSIDMQGLTEGSHANHLHHGSCDDLGDIHITLDGIVADDTGAGSQTTANDEEPLSHFETGHYLAVHQDDPDTIGAIVACGDVVAE